MALIILQPGATSSSNLGSGSDTDSVFGTGGNEIVRLDGDGDVVLDPSFGAGDVVRIDGLRSDYSVTVSGSNIVLTNDTGANIVIPIKENGAQIEFNDDDSQITIKDGQLCIGDQVIPSDGTTVQLDGDGANNAPEFASDEVTIEVDEDGVFNGSLAGAATDADGDPLTFGLETDALNGTVTVNADGTYTYTPNAGFSGNDSYVVSVTDGEATDLLTVNVIVNDGGNGGSGGEGDTIRLTVAADDLDGTAGDDTFRARVVQNSDGFQTNQLGSGDELDGGAGIDLLDAWIQDASPLGAGPSASIMPSTDSVEIAHFRALSAGGVEQQFFTYEDLFRGEEFEGPIIGVEVNAADMKGLTEIGSVGSDNSLTIYNVTTLASGADFGDIGRNTQDVMVRMEFTGNNTALDEASDLTVLFNRDYLLCDIPEATGAILEFEMMDLDAALLLQNEGLSVGDPYPASFQSADNVAADGEGNDTVDGPLDEIPYSSMTFDFGDTTVTVSLLNDPSGSDEDPDNFPVDYDELLANIQANLPLALAAVGLPSDAVSVSVPGQFTASDTDTNPGGSAQGDIIRLTNELNDEELSNLAFDATREVPGDKDFHLEVRDDIAPPPEDCKITVDVKLLKVGNGGDGGELTIGGMTPTLENFLDEESEDGLPELPRGVEQFNLFVEGRVDQPSSLAAVRSTDNTLECVIIEAAEGSEASITIGNRNTTDFDGFFLGDDNDCDVSDVKNNALKDVIVLDAASFDNGAEVWAFLSDEFADKYLDDQDSGAPAADDNLTASYTFGAGDDILNINVDKDNFVSTGTVNREDFAFEADMGAGDDSLFFQIGDGEFSNFFSLLEGTTAANLIAGDGGNWYTNHLLADNVTLSGGAGDDFIYAWGSSAARINGDAGDDVIFTDNSGQSEFAYNCCKATWVFNARTGETIEIVDDEVVVVSDGISDIYNLEGISRVTVADAEGLTVTVQYMDFTVSADVPTGANGSVTDLSIVQAIKEAINNHPVLGDFLVARDGPGGTLVVESLVDGAAAVTDLTVSLGGDIDELSAAELASLGFDTDGTALVDDGDTDTLGDGRFDAQFASDGDDGDLLCGKDSTNVNNNVVYGGTGNDEIALSSNGNSIETLVFLDENFGSDHVLNFSAQVEAEPVDSVAEVQKLTFTVAEVTDDAGATTNDADDDGNFESTAPVDITVTLFDSDGEEQVITLTDVPAGLEADEIAQLVADAIIAEDVDGVDTVDVSDDGSGCVTITFEDDEINYGPPSVVVVPADPTETQTIIIEGDQDGDAIVTLTFNDVSYSVAVLDGTSAEDIVDALVAEINSDPDADLEVIAVDATDGDGTFTLEYYGSTNPALASISGLNTDDLDISQTTFMNDNNVTAEAETIADGTPAIFPEAGFDIMDFSAIIDVDGFYFENTMQVTADKADAVDNLVDAASDGIILVDRTGASVAAEIEDLNELLEAGDTTTQTTATTGIIMSVVGNAENNGVYADVFKVVDGTAAGDAAVESYLGRIYLGGSDLDGTEDKGDKSFIGNFDALTEANFTPLSPSEIIVQYGAVI